MGTESVARRRRARRTAGLRSGGLPCSTWALFQAAHACHSSMSVSALPGTSTAGSAIALSASIVSSRPMVHRREIAGADDHVGLLRHFY